MIKNKKQLSASALLITIFILAGIFVIAFAVGYMTLLAVKAADSQSQGFKAFYAAESGVEKTRSDIKVDANFFSSHCVSTPEANIFGTSTLSSKAYFTIDCLSNTAPYQFVAHGNFKNNQRDLEFSYTPPPAPVASFTPSDLSGLQLWLKADAGVTTSTGNSIATWADQSGSGNNAGQANPSLQPLYVDNFQNGKPAIYFNNVPYMIVPDSATLRGMAGLTAFIVAKKPADADKLNFIGYWGGGGNHYFFRNTDTSDSKHLVQFYSNTSNGYAGVAFSQATTTMSNYEFLYDGSKMNLYLNGIIETGYENQSGSIDNSIGNDMIIGAQYDKTEPATAYILEIILYNSGLSDTDRQKVETYLNNKYSIY